MSKAKALNMKTVLGIIGVYLISQSAFIITPALANISALYPEVPYSSILLLTTLPTLLGTPATLFAGAVAGRKISYKKLTIISLVLCIAGGVIPIFLNGFYEILIARVIFGIGNGLSMPLAAGLVIMLIHPEKQASILGVGTAMQALAGVVFQTISGVLCIININYTWMIHLVLVLPLILVLVLLPEPEMNPQAEKEKAAEKKTSKRLPLPVWTSNLGYGLTFFGFYNLFLNMSAIVTGEGIGTAASAGTITSMYSLGNLLGGFVASKLIQKCGQYTSTLAILALAAGTFFMYLGENVPILMAATLIGGIAVSVTTVSLNVEFSRLISSDMIASANSIMLLFINIACFICSPFTGLVASVTGNPDVRVSAFYGAMISVVSAMIWLAAKVTRKKA